MFRLAAVACYLIALAGAAAFALTVLALGLGFELPAAPVRPAWAADLGWLALFAAQHSVMAREPFKRLQARLLPPRLGRSAYAAASGVLLAALPLVWRPVGGVIWRLPAAVVALPLAGGALLALVNARHDHAGLFGLRQAGGGDEPARLDVGGAYRFVRHPLMACLLVFLWAQPVMTGTLALLSGGLTAIIALGILLEERDLARQFSDYVPYRRRVPMLVPWRGRVRTDGGRS